jgi:hypothetical protein
MLTVSMRTTGAFELRFPKQKVAEWAAQYRYRPGKETSCDEDMIRIGARTRAARHYTRDDFLQVCDWHTRGRARHYYLKNTEEQVHHHTGVALTATDEARRVSSLMLLDGVWWPTASVLLSLGHEDPYPILDSRALWSVGCERPYYTFRFWWAYVCFCRSTASECGVTVAELDRALWAYSQHHQPQRTTKE